MRLLLDTHTFLWFIVNNPLLSSRAKRLIEEAQAVYLSMASIWEMGIKVGTGKLTLTEPLEQLIPKQLLRDNLSLLPIELTHAVKVSILPFSHRDPFDRLIIAQSLVEQVPIVGVDGVFDNYGIQRLW